MDSAAFEVIVGLADAVDALLWSGCGDRVDRCNARWTTFAGWDGGAGRDWQSVVHREEHDRCAAALRHGGDVALRLRAADGGYRLHRVRVVVAAEGRWFAIARGTNDSLKDRFLAAISHELRAPVAAVLLWERVLREPELTAQERARALDAIHHSAVLQARLVDDLLDVARASSGKLAVSLRPLALAPILARALDAARPFADAKKQALVAQIDPALGHVDGDAARLSQIVENVLLNAIKFSSEHGNIALTAARREDDVIIEVADDGRGISPEFLPHVFEVFRQLDDTGPASPGLGLGLAIASELVALHGGTIEARSEGIGRGARFRIRLPGTAHSASEVERKPTQQALAGVSILVVDDDPRVLAALELLLARAGANVACAASVADAWQSLERAVPDVVVADIAMPGADGYELVRRIRAARSSLKLVATLALTAHASINDAHRALAAGFDGHLAKPVEIDVLVTSIVRLVRARATPVTL